MATRLGPRSLTLQTPSRVCVTDRTGRASSISSAALDAQLVLHGRDAADLLRDGLGTLLDVLGVDRALQRDHALVAIDVDGLQRLQADLVGERRMHLAGQRRVLGVLRVL